MNRCKNDTCQCCECSAEGSELMNKYAAVCKERDELKALIEQIKQLVDKELT